MGILQINTEKMGEFLQKRYIVRSKMIIDRSPVPVRDADNCAIWRYQPVPIMVITPQEQTNSFLNVLSQ